MMKFKSLRTRITLWTITAMLLIPAIVGVVIIVKQFALASQFSKTLQESDKILKDTLIRDLEHAMMVNQLDGMREVLRKFSAFNGVRGVYLLNSRGETVLTFGRELDAKPEGRQMEALLSGGNEFQHFTQEGEDSVRLLALPIMNKGECMSCHTGGKVNGALLIKQRSVDVGSERNFLVAIMLISLLVATIGATLTLLVLLSRKVIAPIRELCGATERIGHYDLNVRVPVHGDDEVGELAQSFNRMIDDLKRSRDEVEERSIKCEEAYVSVQAAQRKLVQSEKLAAIGTLVAGIAHEINNPVGIISARTDCMLIEMKEDWEGGQLVDDLMVINRQTGRIAEITRSLLAFARQAPAKLGLLDVNPIVEETVFLVAKQFLKEKITIEKRLSPVSPKVNANDNLLQQVLLDLLNNARDAMPGGGTIIVATATGSDRVEITIADTGEGIPEEILDNIFDPFFTTKGVGKGTGLGLSVSYGIIQEFGGTIEVISRVGEGSKFNITLPRIKEEAWNRA